VQSFARPASPIHPGGAVGFAWAVLRAVTWRAVLVTQALGLLFALYPWLEQWHRPGQPSLLLNLTRQAIAALLVMLAAFAGDEAVRRGWSVWRAFVVVLLCASFVNVLAQQGLLHRKFAVAGPPRDLGAVLSDFLTLGGIWGTALMVYLNRQSARRLLARLRADELERAQAERRLIASRLVATEAQIDPGSVLRQLGEVRDLFAEGRQEADERLDALITGLRAMVARGAAAQSDAERT
jgi:hypothetical protein